MDETRATLIQHIDNIRLFLEHGLPAQMASGHVDASQWVAIIDAYKWLQARPIDLPDEVAELFEESLVQLQNELNAFLDLLRRTASERRTNEPAARTEVFGALQGIRAAYLEKSKRLFALAKQSEVGVDFEEGLIARLGYDEDVSQSLTLTLTEAVGCYRSDHFLASIALSGRALETILYNSHVVLVGEDPDVQGKSVHGIRSALKKKGFPLEDSLDYQMQFIHAVRNKAVHNSIHHPTADEALAVLLFVRSVIQRMTLPPKRAGAA